MWVSNASEHIFHNNVFSILLLNLSVVPGKKFKNKKPNKNKVHSSYDSTHFSTDGVFKIEIVSSISLFLQVL